MIRSDLRAMLFRIALLVAVFAILAGVASLAPLFD